MNNLDAQIIDYLTHCEFQKRLNSKTLKAYKIDLRQFSEFIHISDVADVSSSVLETYISKLHQLYKPKTVKRKIASVKAFFHYLEYKELNSVNQPFYPKQSPSQLWNQCYQLSTHIAFRLPLPINAKMLYVMRLSLNYFLPPGYEFPNYVP